MGTGLSLSPAPVLNRMEATAGFEPAIRVLQTPALDHLATSPICCFGAEEGI